MSVPVSEGCYRAEEFQPRPVIPQAPVVQGPAAFHAPFLPDTISSCLSVRINRERQDVTEAA